jgi:hypothetical protein
MHDLELVKPYHTQPTRQARTKRPPGAAVLCPPSKLSRHVPVYTYVPVAIMPYTCGVRRAN